MKKTVHFLIVCAMIASLSSKADAALIAITDSAFPGGTDNITRDTVTGFDWLDLTASSGISYNDITAQFSSGGTYEGWRHATKAEVNALFTSSAGLTLGSQSLADPLATQLIALVGTTQTNSLLHSTAARGLYNDDASGTNGSLPGVGQVIVRTQSNIFSAQTDVGILDDQPFLKNMVPASGTGHWLVRAVPEPSSMVLLVIGVSGCGIGRLAQKRRRKVS